MAVVRLFLLVTLASSGVGAFAPQPFATPARIRPTTPLVPRKAKSPSIRMASSGDGGNGEGIVVRVTGALILLSLIAGSVLPFLSLSGSLGGGDPASTMVTQDNRPGTAGNKLSRGAIQAKLGSVPTFYLVDKETGKMQTDLFMSYEDAQAVANEKIMVKATTLDQVLYPLVLKQGRMRLDPPPAEVQAAEDELRATETPDSKVYRLVPSKQALSDAANTNLAQDDMPLFQADRLAFAGDNGGIQLPLFADKRDCVTSYKRLSSKKLPAEPTIQVTSLKKIIKNMESGGAPNMNQITFYATEEDINKAVQMIDGQT